MLPKAETLSTSHGAISLADSGGSGPAVLMIHGNSARKEIFRHQFDPALTARYRLLAFDLPGHGESADAADPRRSYTLMGYADLAAEILAMRGIAKATVLGWSLGGHIGIEMINQAKVALSGLLITGTPPVPNDVAVIGKAFHPSPVMDLTGAAEFSDADAELYCKHTCGLAVPLDPLIVAGYKRTHGLSRTTMFESFTGLEVPDQAAVVAGTEVPVAVISGGDESFVNNDYLGRCRYGNLWRGTVFLLPGVGHAPFWEAPPRFNPLFAAFLGEVAG